MQASRWRSITLDLLLLIAAYTWARWCLLDSAFDEVGLWMYELYPMGTMAELIRRGVDIPLSFYYDNAAGQIFSGLVTVPVFEWLGPSYFALKVPPFLLGVGLLIATYAFLRGQFSRMAAWIGGLLWILPPTVLFKYSVTCSGNHFENLFFSSLVLCLLFRTHRLGITRARLVILGISAGFALFIFLGALLTLALGSLVHWGLRGWRQTLRDAPWLALGALIGLSPLIALNVATGGRGLGFLEAKFAGEGAAAASTAAEPWARVEHYLVEKLPQAPNAVAAWGHTAEFWNEWLTICLWIVYGLCVCLALPGLWHLARSLFVKQPTLRWQQAVWIPFALYLPLSALAFAVSNFRIGGYAGILGYGGYRYYLPWFAYSLIATAALVGAAWLQRRWSLRWSSLALALAVAIPGTTNLELIPKDPPVRGLGFAYPGYDLPKIARALIAGRNALSRSEQIRYLESFPPALRHPVVRAIGYNLGVLQIEANTKAASDGIWWCDLEALTREWPAEDARELARGAGIGARFHWVVQGHDIGGLLPGLQATWSKASPRTRELLADFAEGLAASNPTLPLFDQTEAITSATNGLLGQLVQAQMDPVLVQGVARGQGFLCGQLWQRGLAPDRERVRQRKNELFAEVLPQFFEGLGMGLAAMGGDAALADDFLRTEAERNAFRSGYERERAALGAR